MLLVLRKHYELCARVNEVLHKADLVICHEKNRFDERWTFPPPCRMKRYSFRFGLSAEQIAQLAGADNDDEYLAWLKEIENETEQDLCD